MENLQRRRSGIYVARLTVPERLRQLAGKREFIASTGTTNLHVAKLVAATVLARWRGHLFQLERAATRGRMDDETILKIAHGHPLLVLDTHMRITQAAPLLGVDVERLLRFAGEGRLGLYYSMAGQTGYIVARDDLEVDDPELGTRVVPGLDAMPEGATRHVAYATLAVPRTDLEAIAGALRAAGEAGAVAFSPAEGPAGSVFVPDSPIALTVENIEVSTREIERLRAALAERLHAGAVQAAQAAQRARQAPSPSPVGRNAHRRLSEALDLYASKFLPQKITSPKEIQRVKTGIGLLIEFEGDLTLAEVDSDRLRHFRDTHLARVPARENDIRAKFKTSAVSESIKAIEGTNWPMMSASERNQRMQWIARMLEWLKDQGWITSNPATALRGEFVDTKADRKLAALNQKAREPFTTDDLRLIFGQEWFETGRGRPTGAGTYREFQPFKYWLPLLGLYVGGRINELAQLHLDDVRVTDAGTWYISINRDTQDKSLKQQKESTRCWSAREVPLHPRLIELGFVQWCKHLRTAGFRRVFPELSWNPTNHYAKEPIRAMSQMLAGLGMPRDNTKVFHSFRHTVNNALMRIQCAPEMRKRLMGHEPGEGVNERTYLTDPTPDETLPIMRQLAFQLPAIARFDLDAGVAAVRDALRRKNNGRGALEALGEPRPSDAGTGLEVVLQPRPVN